MMQRGANVTWNALLTMCLAVFSPGCVSQAEVSYAGGLMLRVREAPAHGLVMAPIILPDAASVDPKRMSAVIESDGSAVPIQFVPTADFDGSQRVVGTVVLRLPGAGDWLVRLHLDNPAPSEKTWDGQVRGPGYTAMHDPARQGGLPWRIQFTETGKVFDSFVFNDRMHHADAGGFPLRDDPAPQVERISEGALCTVVRVRGRFMNADGKAAPPGTQGVYDWYYFHDLPLVHVDAMLHQAEGFSWKQAHFLELNFPDQSFTHWAGGDPLRQGEFKADGSSFDVPDWGALIDGRNAIGMFRSGRLRFHDGRGNYGTYLHAHADRAWQEWAGTERRMTAWMWIGAADDPIAAMRGAMKYLPVAARVAVTSTRLRNAITEQRSAASQQDDSNRRDTLWRVALAEKLETQGRTSDALAMLKAEDMDAWTTLPAGDLKLTLHRTDDGVSVQSLFDAASGRELLADRPLPLFTLKLRHTETKRQVELVADSGWRAVSIDAHDDVAELRWRGPRDESMAGLEVVARAEFDGPNHAVRWSLNVQNQTQQWSVMHVVFPQLALAELGADGWVFLPRAPGEVQQGLWRRPFRHSGLYPEPWTTMQYAAAYDAEGQTGLYVARHDPDGRPKRITIESEPNERAVTFTFEHPAANMTIAGNDFELTGPTVWQLLRGDWFDAAVIYRDWVRAHAKWYPQLTAEGRADTPQWMRQLPVWLQLWRTDEKFVSQATAFAKYVDVPVAAHIYNWQNKGFDQDYPHYFPPKPGFSDIVKRLHDAGVYVMPYINGRLWDMRDRGLADYQFTSHARPHATKDEHGEPYVEIYGKESDGSPTRFAVMCPATEFWQNKVRDICMRLFDEYHVDAVYLDQVAARFPLLCMDRSHGHPLGGGRWWNDGYWQMMQKIRDAMPDGAMLTTECNSEPFAHSFDGYLVWNWQHEGMVPAFMAVYGSAIQMFGRAYQWGETHELAWNMRCGQQLVFGEQIGWFYPGIMDSPQNAPFVRQCARLRWLLRDYFSMGEMARPPRFSGDIPKVRADWMRPCPYSRSLRSSPPATLSTSSIGGASRPGGALLLRKSWPSWKRILPPMSKWRAPRC